MKVQPALPSQAWMVKAEAAYWGTFDTALTRDLLCVSGFHACAIVQKRGGVPPLARFYWTSVNTAIALC